MTPTYLAGMSSAVNLVVENECIEVMTHSVRDLERIPSSASMQSGRLLTSTRISLAYLNTLFTTEVMYH